MSNVDFYYFIISPFCRSILYEAKILGLKLNLKSINLLKGEHKSEEFLKVNPHHKVPTITDGDLCLGESRAIMVYLFNKYADDKFDYLYPKDLKKRAKVDQFLYYICSTVSPTILGHFKILFFDKRKPTDEETKKFESGLDEIEKCYFQDSTFLFGENPTLADLDLAAIFSQLDMITYDFSKYPGINKFMNASKNADWLKSCNEELTKASAPFVKEYQASIKA